MELQTPYTLSKLTPLIGFIIVFVIFILALTRFDTYMKYKGIDNCAKASRFEQTITDQNAKVSYPVQDVYKDCLSKKNIK